MRKVKSSGGSGSAFGSNWVPGMGKLKKSASSAAGFDAGDSAALDVWDESAVDLGLEPNMDPKALPFEHPPTSPREPATGSRGARRANELRAVYAPVGSQGASRDRPPPKVAGLAKDSHIASARGRQTLDSIEEASGKAPQGTAGSEAADISSNLLARALALATPWQEGAFRPSDYVSPRPESRGPGSSRPQGPGGGGAPKDPQPRRPAATKINLEMREMPRSLRKALMMSEPTSDHYSDATGEDWGVSGDADWDVASEGESSGGEPQTVLIHGGANQYWSDFCEDSEGPQRTCDGDRGDEDAEGSSEFAFPQVLGARGAEEATKRAGGAGEAAAYVQEAGRRGQPGARGDNRLDLMDLFLPARGEPYVQEGEGDAGPPSGPPLAAEPGSYGSDLEGCGESGECSPQRTLGKQRKHACQELNYFTNTIRKSKDGCRPSFDSDEGPPLVDTAFEGPRRGPAVGDKGGGEGRGNKGSRYMYDTAHTIAVSADGGHQQAAWVWDTDKSDAAEALQTRSSRTSPIPSVGHGRILHTYPNVSWPSECDPDSVKIKGGCFEPSAIIAAIFRKLTGRSGRKAPPAIDLALSADLTWTGGSLGEDGPNRRRMQMYQKRQSSMLKVVEQRLQDTGSARRPSHTPGGEPRARPRGDRQDACRLDRDVHKPARSANKDGRCHVESRTDGRLGMGQGRAGCDVQL